MLTTKLLIYSGISIFLIILPAVQVSNVIALNNNIRAQRSGSCPPELRLNGKSEIFTSALKEIRVDSKAKVSLINLFNNLSVAKLKQLRKESLLHLNFSEWKGYVFGFPPAVYSREELENIKIKALELDNEASKWLKEMNASLNISVFLPFEINEDYARSVAEILGETVKELRGDRVKVMVAFLADRYHILNTNFTLKNYVNIINILLHRNLTVKIKTLGYGKYFVVISPRKIRVLDESEFKAILDGSEGNISYPQEVGTVLSEWTCGVTYGGLIYVWNYGFNSPYWFWYYPPEPPRTSSGCESTAPSENGNCDIHYERRMFFFTQGDLQSGLIDFYGSKFAKNCYNGADYCGKVNTKFHGICAIRYSDLGDRLYQDTYSIAGTYTVTSVSGKCPYYNYCGCYGTCSYFQVFVTDISYP